MSAFHQILQKLSEQSFYRAPLHQCQVHDLKDRSSHRRCSVKKGVLKNFVKFTGKQLSQSVVFNKVAGVTKSLKQKRDTMWKIMTSVSSRNNNLWVDRNSQIIFYHNWSLCWYNQSRVIMINRNVFNESESNLQQF